MITKDLLRALRIDIDEALIAVAEKHNIELKTGNASFTDENATFKLDVASIGDGGVAVTKIAADFKFNSFNFHMKPEDLGTEFTSPYNEKFVLMGCKPRSKKATLIAKKVDTGVMHKLPLAAFPGASCIGYR